MDLQIYRLVPAEHFELHHQRLEHRHPQLLPQWSRPAVQIPIQLGGDGTDCKRSVGNQSECWAGCALWVGTFDDADYPAFRAPIQQDVEPRVVLVEGVRGVRAGPEF
jgi:hypothetical protein